MLLLKVLFWLGILTIVYSYAGYGLLVWFLLKAKNIFGGARTKIATPTATADFPAVTLIIAAYNEEDFIRQKIDNTLSLEYPKDKLQIIFITDGSSDATPRLASGYERITVMHRPERKGKVAAMHRAMQQVTTPIVIFSDANTLLNKESIYNIARHYQDPKTGGVAGEKKIMETSNGKVAGIGEGLYWKYESFLKKMDAELYTVVGAAGELFSIRTELYEPVGDNVLLDDFVISLRVCQKGYRVHYEPEAFAMETPSASLKDERKRKIRISAGAFQSMGMLIALLNIFKYPVLSFQYISHRVLRWTLCPLFLPVVFIVNLLLMLKGEGLLYQLILAGQVLFYIAAMAGWLLANRNVKSKLLYVPYYFFFLNFSLYQGFFRHLKGRQSVLWDKARRETPTPAQ